MSKKLDDYTCLSSIGAVKEFKQECLGYSGYKVLANVKVLNENDDIIHNVNVDVFVDLGTNFHKVSIMWEQELGDDFKKLDHDLYGIYSTDYNEMIYSYRELSIYSDDRLIIIQA